MISAVGIMWNALWAFQKLVLACVIWYCKLLRGSSTVARHAKYCIITSASQAHSISWFELLFFLQGKRISLSLTCTEPTFAFFRGSFLQFLQAGGCAGPHAWRCWRTLNSIVTKLLSLNITKYKHVYIQFSHTYMEWLCVCVRK